VATRELEIVASQTKPPARFTEATLLGAMEGAGKLVDDEELRAAMSEKGLGTPATRAAIIEGLLRETYLHRVGKELEPTAKAFSLMALLRGLGIPELTAPGTDRQLGIQAETNGAGATGSRCLYARDQ
jgi:DNA topoisomerase III